MPSQKKLIILIIISASLTSFLAGYLLTRPEISSDIIEQQRGSLIDRFSDVGANASPTPLPPGLLQATTDASLAATNSADENSIIYYHPINGYVSKLGLERRDNTLVSTVQLTGLVNVIWSPDKSKVVTVSRGSAGFVYKYFDYISHENGLLGTNIKSVVFSPDGKQIALVRSAGGDSLIQIADCTGKESATILKTRLTNVNLSWPTANTISFTANDNEATSQSLYLLTLGGDLSQIIESEDGLSARWSPDGTKLLYSTSQDSKIISRIFDTHSKQSKILPVSTSANNCTWLLDGGSILCAVEYQGQTSVSKISVLENIPPQILFSNLIITPQNVFMSHLQDFLVIISASDQSIWALKLQ